MRICEVKLKGFRNFMNATINFTEKTLIIGSNDIGKSNLLHALRLILDKSLSEIDLEPKDSDFYVHKETNEIYIQIKFEEVTEDCILSKLRENVSDNGTLYLAYKAVRDPKSKKKTYCFLAGKDEASIRELQGRFYLKVLNLKYIGSNRDLFSFVKRERKYLLQDSKEKREEGQIATDDIILTKIEKSLDNVNKRVTKLSYIKESTENINNELKELSFHNESQDVVFDVGASDPSVFVDNLELVTKVNGKRLTIGGDGRNNQIFLALWAARNEMQEEDPLEVIIYCIEEPEAHLHPHQQRKLADYLANTLKSQVIITTHSPQIACEFPPESIIRLFDNRPDTLAACNGCSDFIEGSVIQFGYRLNILPAECFFSRVVLLVEGPSEYLFYKALAPAIDIDLDRLNISILNVEGVGFNTYVDLLTNLEIDWVIRTDNDIFKLPHNKLYRFAGIQRCIGIYNKYCTVDKDFEVLAKVKNLLSGFKRPKPPQGRLKIAKNFINKLKRFNMFIADVDLETDISNSALSEYIHEFFPSINNKDKDLVKQMQKQKATFMYSFLQEHADKLGLLKDDPLSKPLLRCKEIVGDE